MKLKKIPYNFTLLLLTSGASLILGFLSFGGMLALSPFLPLAFAAFALSVAYEGEIYIQNIKGALNKLFKHNHMKLDMAKAYLLDLFTVKNLDTTSDACPQFFKDYQAQCELLIQFGHKTLDAASLKRRKQVEKTLRDMEKWFARQLFNQGENNTLIAGDYQQKLQVWLKKNGQEQQILDFNERKTHFHLLKAFSVLAAMFMGLGTTYLLMEAFAAIPMMAALSATTLPLLVVPMALIAGVAYGLLTYNAMTDMLTNNRVKAAFKRIFQSNDGWSLHRGAMAVMALLLATLAVTLTVCTAGTWWTIAKEVQPLFSWMKKMPDIIMGVINPIVTGISALIFNLQNTAESLEIIEGLSPPEHGPLQQIQDLFEGLQKNEHWSQWLNPFRLLLKLTITPLRVILFLGHLISIGVTADRVPGISQILSALIGIISEGFEDLHYFVGHGEGGCCGHHHHEDIHSFLTSRLSPGHGHNHDLDLPTKALRFIFIPVYGLAAGWDYIASQFNSDHPLTFDDAWNKQRGNQPADHEESVVVDDTNKPSFDWNVEYLVHGIHRRFEKNQVAEEEIVALHTLQEALRAPENRADEASVRACLQAKSGSPLNQHRFWSESDTKTAQFVREQLPSLLPMP